MDKACCMHSIASKCMYCECKLALCCYRLVLSIRINPGLVCRPGRGVGGGGGGGGGVV